MTCTGRHDRIAQPQMSNRLKEIFLGSTQLRHLPTHQTCGAAPIYTPIRV